MVVVRFFKMLIMISYGVVKNQHVQSTLLGGREGGGHKKEYHGTLCTLLIMLTIMDDTLDSVYRYSLFSRAVRCSSCLFHLETQNKQTD